MDRTRHEALDVARMLAALAVVVHHARAPMGLGFGPLDPSLGLAVYVFFALSGFLVFRPFVRGPVPPAPHLVRRMLRIFPAYLVALGVTLALAYPYPAGRELQYALMLQPSDSVRAPGVASVAWTLHIEVVFYVALPMLAALLAAVCGERHRGRAGVLAALGVASLAALVASDPAQATWPARPWMAPLMLWAFVPGMLVAWAVERSSGLDASLRRWPVTALGATMLSIALLTPSTEWLLWPKVMAATGMALMIPGLLAVRALPRPLAAVASGGRTLSYATYLWHITVVVAVAGAGLRGWLGTGVAVVIVLVVSAGSWLFVERPAIGLSRWLTSRAPVGVGAARWAPVAVAGPARGVAPRPTVAHALAQGPAGPPTPAAGRRRRGPPPA